MLVILIKSDKKKRHILYFGEPTEEILAVGAQKCYSLRELEKKKGSSNSYWLVNPLRGWTRGWETGPKRKKASPKTSITDYKLFEIGGKEWSNKKELLEQKIKGEFKEKVHQLSGSYRLKVYEPLPLEEDLGWFEFFDTPSKWYDNEQAILNHIKEVAQQISADSTNRFVGTTLFLELKKTNNSFKGSHQQERLPAVHSNKVKEERTPMVSSSMVQDERTPMVLAGDQRFIWNSEDGSPSVCSQKGPLDVYRIRRRTDNQFWSRMDSDFGHPAVTQTFTVPELKQIAAIMNAAAEQTKKDQEFKAIVVDFTPRICKHLIEQLYSDKLNAETEKWKGEQKLDYPNKIVNYLYDCWTKSNKNDICFRQIKTKPYLFIDVYNSLERPVSSCPGSEMDKHLKCRYGVLLLKRASQFLGVDHQSIYNLLQQASEDTQKNRETKVRMSRTKLSGRSLVFTMKNARWNTNFKEGESKTYTGRDLMSGPLQMNEGQKKKLRERFWKLFHSNQKWDSIEFLLGAIPSQNNPKADKWTPEKGQRYNEWVEEGREQYYFWCTEETKKETINREGIKQYFPKNPPIINHLLRQTKLQEFTFEQLFHEYLDLLEYHTYGYDDSTLGRNFKQIRERLRYYMGPYSYKLADTLVEINYYGKEADQAGIGYHGDTERGGIGLYEHKKINDIPGMVVGFNCTPQEGQYRYITFAPFAPGKSQLLFPKLADSEILEKIEEENLVPGIVSLEESADKKRNGFVYAIKLEGGDAYIMASSSLGLNHKKKSELRIKHAAGHPKKTWLQNVKGQNLHRTAKDFSAKGPSAVATYSAVAESDSALQKFADQSSIILNMPFTARTLVPELPT